MIPWFIYFYLRFWKTRVEYQTVPVRRLPVAYRSENAQWLRQTRVRHRAVARNARTKSRWSEKSRHSKIGNKRSSPAAARDRSLKSAVRNEQLKRRSRIGISVPPSGSIGDRDGRSVRAAVYDECEISTSIRPNRRWRPISSIAWPFIPFRNNPLFVRSLYRSLSPRNA